MADSRILARYFQRQLWGELPFRLDESAGIFDPLRLLMGEYQIPGVDPKHTL